MKKCYNLNYTSESAAAHVKWGILLVHVIPLLHHYGIVNIILDKAYLFMPHMQGACTTMHARSQSITFSIITSIVNTEMNSMFAYTATIKIFPSLVNANSGFL